VINLALVFATGITTGGLSCLAVQGGLLASSLQSSPTGSESKTAAIPARPIVLFLGSKLIAYTLLGAGLGWLGSLLQLTPMMRAVLQITMGIFMVGTALRLLKVHPIFRHFVIAPPKFVTRYIRRRSKHADGSWLAPTFLGSLTVLIPCGVTQAMMALAVASASSATGALIMFAFVLGTSPVFFSVVYLATKLGARWQDKFWKITGTVVLLLGTIAIDSGLVLAGSPVSLTATGNAVTRGLRAAANGQTSRQGADLKAVVASEGNDVTLNITDQSYTPAVMQAKAGMPIKLTLHTDNVRGCARSVVIASLNTQKLLGSSDTQVILLPPQVAGSSIRLTCIMGMYNAQINII
jgi:uncharacterized protein